MDTFVSAKYVAATFVPVSVQRNISANTTPILSKLGPTLRIGYIGHMHELITVLAKFVPATFVSLSGQWNISADTNLMFT